MSEFEEEFRFEITIQNPDSGDWELIVHSIVKRTTKEFFDHRRVPWSEICGAYKEDQFEEFQIV